MEEFGLHAPEDRCVGPSSYSIRIAYCSDLVNACRKDLRGFEQSFKVKSLRLSRALEHPLTLTARQVHFANTLVRFLAVRSLPPGSG